MAACTPCAYTGVTQARWDAIKAAVAADYSIFIGPDAGSASGDGFTLSWAWDANTGNLTVTCIDSPWWAGCTLINNTIDGLIKPLLA